MLARRAFLRQAAGGTALLVGRARRSPAAPSPGLGQRLAALVDRYAHVEHHRTGTSAEGRSTRWFARELARRGADVVLLPYAFTRCAAQARVRLGGVRVPCLPLPYEWSGRVATAMPAVDTILLHGNLDAPDLDARIAAARAARSPALVLATDSTLAAGGRLVVPNRIPEPGSGLPVVLVGGAHAEALRTGEVMVRARATLVPGRSANVVARLGTVGGAPVVIATPLSGWFRCAAERGSGIAIALELATLLARSHPVMVVGTTGHELGYLGLRRLLGAGLHPVPRLVLHLGASLAAMEYDGRGGRALAPLRLVADDFTAATHAAVAAALEPAGFLPLPTGAFVGEGTLWQGHGAPVLSFSGTFPLFHTPDDVPALTIEPGALGEVFTAVAEAAEVAIRAVS